MLKCNRYTILLVIMILSFFAKASEAFYYRDIPNEPLTHVTIPKKLTLLHSQWNQAYSGLVKSGKQPIESYEKGYLDTDQPELQNLAKKLSKYANKYNGTLLYIIRYSPDAIQRSEAAALLSWSSQPKNLDFILQWDLMNDPANDVRHNLVKAVSSRLNTIQDKSLLEKTIHAFCEHTAFPLHNGRNKVIFSLQHILSTDLPCGPT